MKSNVKKKLLRRFYFNKYLKITKRRLNIRLNIPRLSKKTTNLNIDTMNVTKRHIIKTVSYLQPCFDLKKVLDKTRDDFEVVNQGYENVVIFMSKNHIGRIFSFNFCTLFFSEIKEEIIEDRIAYKIVRSLNCEIPDNFQVFSWNKDEIANVYNRQKPKIYKTFKI